MIGRMLALGGGLAGGLAASQLPEFAQQYTQRLGGQVEALERVVQDFDASAARSELTRDAALEELRGSRFLEDRRADMEQTFARYDRLREDLVMLRLASPVERMLMPQRLDDPQTLNSTWVSFEPAVPFTPVGIGAGIVGYLGGTLLISLLLSALGWPFRAAGRRWRDRPAKVPEGARVEPTLAAPRR